MKYPPLSEVRKTLRVNWYRCPIEPADLRELLKRSDRQGFLQAGGHLAIWLCTGSLVYLAWYHSAWVWLLAALFVHGIVSSFFSGTAPHELGHGTVFKTPWLNRLFLYVFSFISWWDPFDYASSHTYHHRYTLHPEADRENLLPLSPAASPFSVLQLLTIRVFGEKGRTFGKGGLLSAVYVTALSAMRKTGSSSIPSNEWLDAIHQDQPAQFEKSVVWSRLLLVFHGAVFFGSLLSGQWIFIFIVSTSSFTANILSHLVGTTQHCGLKESDSDFRKSTRSITLPPVMEFLYWHMNWHTEHHMFAGVPCYNLKRLHSLVKGDMPEPRSLRGAWREMTSTWRIQQHDASHYFDTVVPASKASHSSNSTEFQSIGELAPQGLKEI